MAEWLRLPRRVREAAVQITVIIMSDLQTDILVVTLPGP